MAAEGTTRTHLQRNVTIKRSYKGGKSMLAKLSLKSLRTMLEAAEQDPDKQDVLLITLNEAAGITFEQPAKEPAHVATFSPPTNRATSGHRSSSNTNYSSRTICGTSPGNSYHSSPFGGFSFFVTIPVSRSSFQALFQSSFASFLYSFAHLLFLNKSKVVLFILSPTQQTKGLTTNTLPSSVFASATNPCLMRPAVAL